jgi:hypothetical protein
LKKQSQFAGRPDERKAFSSKELWRFLPFCDCGKRKPNKANFKVRRASARMLLTICRQASHNVPKIHDWGRFGLWTG